MYRVVIKRYGRGRDELFEGLKSIDDIEICGFTDKDTKLWGNLEKGYPVYSIFQIAELYREKKVDKVIFTYEIGMSLMDRMVKEAVNLGIRKGDIWIAKPEFYVEQVRRHICEYEEYKRLPYIEYHVTDHCNLNCKGCVHFAPLVQGEKYADYETLKRDLLQLKKLVPYIDKIHILGGEPFLNKELGRYIELTREVYPFSNISVVTNGLMLIKMKADVIESLRKNKVRISISSYPPILSRINDIVAYVKDQGIEIDCTEPIYQFAYTFDSKGGHAEGAKRINCTCPNLYEGHLAVCPPIAYMKYYNDYFNQNMTYEDGLIDIYDENLTYKVLVDELHKIRKVCDKCLFISKEDAVFMDWEQSKLKNINDYVWRGED